MRYAARPDAPPHSNRTHKPRPLKASGFFVSAHPDCTRRVDALLVLFRVPD